uniref:hypothetical protein n=1 Tax=Agathobacter sp. TaxID=2021311 RepID=UPI0040575EBF
MNNLQYEEMVLNVDLLIQEHVIQNKKIYLFGYCNATEELADLLLDKGFLVASILDNNIAKQGKEYRGIMIQSPESILMEKDNESLVCIAARAYAAMNDQLKRLGYGGKICKLVDYNSYAEYSLSKETIFRMKERVVRGRVLLQALKEKNIASYRILCPFAALGDIYIMMSYLPYFLKKKGIQECVVGVIGNACAQVVRLFGEYDIAIYSQKDMDEIIQAVLYDTDENTFIAHQDRPYLVNLPKALYEKCISLEQIYCCGVFGLPIMTEPYKPIAFQEYGRLHDIKEGQAVILSPYAKSVASIKGAIWKEIVEYYTEKGYQCFTNVIGAEKPLSDTMPISPCINEMKSVAERAGIFIGIRSGLCDVLKEADCRKIALYPDYNYCDTQWKALDMYRLDGWENIVIGDGFQWRID